MRVLRASVLHTPGDPFGGEGALEAFDDGGLAFAEGRVAAVGPFEQVRRAHPEGEVVDLRGGVVVPGFVDTHVHYPQVRVIGALGHDGERLPPAPAGAPEPGPSRRRSGGGA